MDRKFFEFCGYEFTSTREGGRLIHPDEPTCWYDPDCVQVHNKQLELGIRVNPTRIQYWNGKTYFPYFGVGSAMSVKSDFSYGTYEFVARLPYGKHICCALWLSGSYSWPPEIDILEGFNTQYRKKYLTWPGKVGNPLLPSYKVETNVHYRLSDGELTNVGGKGIKLNVLNDPTEQFNTYTLCWDADRVAINYNGKLVREITDPVVLKFLNKHPRMYLLMTVNVFDKTTFDDDIAKSKFVIKDFKYRPLCQDQC